MMAVLVNTRLGFGLGAVEVLCAHNDRLISVEETCVIHGSRKQKGSIVLQCVSQRMLMSLAVRTDTDSEKWRAWLMPTPTNRNIRNRPARLVQRSILHLLI